LLTPCFSFLPPVRPPISALFPYTTLFRSEVGDRDADLHRCAAFLPRDAHETAHRLNDDVERRPVRIWPVETPAGHRRVDEARVRSEEHTSELQSRVDLVCRLLLEKKNTTL